MDISGKQKKDRNDNSETLLSSAIDLVSSDLEAVNELIHKRLKSDITLIQTLGHYIIKSGGKRLRPLILLLAAKACGYLGDQHIILAAVIEFIHTATLLHDDVVDSSTMRRGKSTANAVWGNEASVLVGDFLYTRSFEMMVETQNMEIMRILSETTTSIAEGEVLQLLNTHSTETTEEVYMQIVSRKTAKLFESAAGLAGIISSQHQTICKALSNYGTHIGIAFQLIDDILDYDADYRDIGKNVGDDLAEGKPTLPLICALKEGNSFQKRLIKDAIIRGDRSQIQEIVSTVKSTGTIDYTKRRAKKESELAVQAIDPLIDTVYKEALIRLATFSVKRHY